MFFFFSYFIIIDFIISQILIIIKYELDIIVIKTNIIINIKTNILRKLIKKYRINLIFFFIEKSFL